MQVCRFQPKVVTIPQDKFVVGSTCNCPTDTAWDNYLKMHGKQSRRGSFEDQGSDTPCGPVGMGRMKYSVMSMQKR